MDPFVYSCGAGIVNPHPHRGWPEETTVIAIEGIDGSGKSTLVNSLGNEPRLIGAFSQVSIVPEFGSPLGMCLREGLRVMSPNSIAYAFAAERHWLIEHCDPTPGSLVLWDRYVDSAYACRSADVQAGRAPASLMDVVQEVTERMPKATATLYLDTSVVTATARLEERRRLLDWPVRSDPRLLRLQREAYERLWRDRTPPPARLDGEASRAMVVAEATDVLLSLR
jgi:thymidylate kinase